MPELQVRYIRIATGENLIFRRTLHSLLNKHDNEPKRVKPVEKHRSQKKTS